MKRFEMGDVFTRKSKVAKKIYLDFDGTIVDSQDIAFGIKMRNPEESWEDFSSNLDWKSEVFDKCRFIFEAEDVLDRLVKDNVDFTILTKINSTNEMNAKVQFIRKKLRLRCPIIFVGPGTRKDEVIVPDQDSVLIDDSKRNIDRWIASGGTGYHIDSQYDNTDGYGINSLDYIFNNIINNPTYSLSRNESKEGSLSFGKTKGKTLKLR